MDLPNYAYFQGKIVPYSEAHVGVLTHGLNYGTAAFAGIRAYWNQTSEKLFVFRPLDHFRRFLQSTRLLLMQLPYTPEDLVQITLDLIKQEGYRRDIYIRPLAYKSDELIGVRLHNLTDSLSIVAVPINEYMSNVTDANVTFSSWRRVDDNSIPARGKISGAYVNSALVKTDAQMAGFDDALVLNQDGHIAEGSAMNIFMLRDGVLYTPPITDNILEGITRRTVIELARKELDLTVVERPIDRTEVYLCDELFFTGTAVQITAVTHVDNRPVDAGVMGPVTSQLRRLFDDVVRGRCEKYMEWLVEAPVSEPV